MDNSVINPVNFSPKNHSTEIDSLRAVAALLVFFFHSSVVMIKPNPELPPNALGYILSFDFTGATGGLNCATVSSYK
jgi:peptidoglycan/LPS O-acetylase OafA/YrhL